MKKQLLAALDGKKEYSLCKITPPYHQIVEAKLSIFA